MQVKSGCGAPPAPSGPAQPGPPPARLQPGDVSHYPKYPDPLKGPLQKEVTLGDLHGNAFKLLFFLLNEGAIRLDSKDDYDTFIKLYDKESNAPADKTNLTEADLFTFRSILSKIKKTEHSVYVRLIGDTLADRGANDYMTLALFNQLDLIGVPFEIMISNHDISFLQSVERMLKRKTLNTPFDEGSVDAKQTASLNRFQALCNAKRVSFEHVEQLITQYQKHLKAISYLHDSTEKKVSVFTHAPFPWQYIQRWANTLGIAFSTDTPDALKKSINAVDKAFSEALSHPNFLPTLAFIIPLSESLDKSLTDQQAIWVLRALINSKQATIPHPLTWAFLTSAMQSPMKMDAARTALTTQQHCTDKAVTFLDALQKATQQPSAHTDVVAMGYFANILIWNRQTPGELPEVGKALNKGTANEFQVQNIFGHVGDNWAKGLDLTDKTLQNALMFLFNIDGDSFGKENAGYKMGYLTAEQPLSKTSPSNIQCLSHEIDLTRMTSHLGSALNAASTAYHPASLENQNRAIFAATNKTHTLTVQTESDAVTATIAAVEGMAEPSIDEQITLLAKTFCHAWIEKGCADFALEDLSPSIDFKKLQDAMLKEASSKQLYNEMFGCFIRSPSNAPPAAAPPRNARWF